MQNKISITGYKARELVIKGAERLAIPVGASLGPFGLNSLIEKGETETNDGFKISRELCGTIENEFERRGAITLHKACAKTNDEVGDATTSSEVLALAITKEAMRFLPKDDTTFISKKRPVEIIADIKASKEKVIKALEDMAQPVATREDLIASALVSVEDKDLALLIGGTQWDLGPDGVIIAEDTNEPTSSISIIKGVRSDNGFATPSTFDDAQKQQIEIKDTAVILTNYVIETLGQVKTIADQLATKGQRRISIIARGFSGQAIMEINKNAEAGLFFFPINAPYTNQGEIMKDIQAVVGGTYINTESGRLEDAQLSDVGWSGKIIARRWDTVITSNGTDVQLAERVQKRIDRIDKELAGTPSDFEKALLEKRKATLTNGMGLLKIGADTEFERTRIKDKADDAVNAVRLALKGGTVEGAGIAFKKISDDMDAEDILKRPLLTINDLIMNSAPKGFVVESWVRDPLLVLKAALENACSVAAALFTTNTVICTKNKKECYCSSSQGQANE